MGTFAIKDHRETLIGRYVMCPVQHMPTPVSKYYTPEPGSPEPTPRYKYHPGWIVATSQNLSEGSIIAYVEDERGKILTSRLEGLVFDDEKNSQWLTHVRMADLMWEDEQIAQRKAAMEQESHD